MRSGLSCSEPCVLADFFRASHEAMYITTRDGYFLRVNASFERMLGYGSGELDGRPVADTYGHSADREEFMAAVEREGTVRGYQLSLKKKNGGLVLCQIDATAWDDGQGMCGYRGIVRTKEGILESFRRYVNLLQPGKSSRGSSFVQDPSLLTDHMTEEVLGYMDRTGLNPLKTARRRVTIVFFDIRGSTTIAERLEPEAFASILNDIFTDIMDLVYGHKGSVNKLIGDGMMATFGCPLASGDDAINAVEAAIGIQEYLSTFNDVRPPGIGKDIRAGIGIATGEVFAGLIGSVRRQEYTVLGDAVNVASRLESLTKSLATPILMDEATYLAVRHRLACVQVACGRLRGKADQVRVYALR